MVILCGMNCGFGAIAAAWTFHLQSTLNRNPVCQVHLCNSVCMPSVGTQSCTSSQNHANWNLLGFCCLRQLVVSQHLQCRFQRRLMYHPPMWHWDGIIKIKPIWAWLIATYLDSGVLWRNWQPWLHSREIIVFVLHHPILYSCFLYKKIHMFVGSQETGTDDTNTFTWIDYFLIWLAFKCENSLCINKF